jgi:uncharacterized protein (TIGR03083 family)
MNALSADQEAEPFVDQAELLRRLDQEYRRFHAIIAPLTPDQLRIPGVVGAWAIIDVIAHFIAHEQFALRELAHARQGEVYDPAENDTDAVNEQAVAEQRHQSVDEVLQAWDASYRQVLAAVRALSDADFDPAGPVAQVLDDSIDGALGNNTYDHYVEHMPAIESWIGQHASPQD